MTKSITKTYLLYAKLLEKPYLVHSIIVHVIMIINLMTQELW